MSGTRATYKTIQRLERKHTLLRARLGKDHPKVIEVGVECFDRMQALRRGETLAQYRKHLASIPK